MERVQQEKSAHEKSATPEKYTLKVAKYKKKEIRKKCSMESIVTD